MLIHALEVDCDHSTSEAPNHSARPLLWMEVQTTYSTHLKMFRRLAKIMRCKWNYWNYIIISVFVDRHKFILHKIGSQCIDAHFPVAHNSTPGRLKSKNFSCISISFRKTCPIEDNTKNAEGMNRTELQRYHTIADIRFQSFNKLEKYSARINAYNGNPI